MNATGISSFNCVTVKKLNMYSMLLCPVHVIICISAVIGVLSLFRARQLQWTGARETGTLWWFCCRMHGKSSLMCHLLQCMHPVRESMAKGCKTARLPGSVLNWHVSDRCWYICSVSLECSSNFVILCRLVMNYGTSQTACCAIYLMRG